MTKEMMERATEDLRSIIQEQFDEIKSLNKRLAGMKGANASMSKRLGRYKALCAEGDAINEERLAKIESLESTLKEKEKVIKGLNDAVERASQVHDDNLLSVIDERDELKRLVDEYDAMPWYERIFAGRIRK